MVLVTGIVLFLFSFLFWGRQQGPYCLMLLTGASFVFFSFLVVIARDSPKSKWIWVAMIIAAVIVQRLTEPIFINWSFRILLSTNSELFNQVNKVLISKPSRIYYWNKASFDTSTLFTSSEKTKVRTLFETGSVYYISKDSVHVYYEMFGMLESRIGISYFYNGFVPPNSRKKIKGAWYY